jgi:hypothetical protein
MLTRNEGPTYPIDIFQWPTFEKQIAFNDGKYEIRFSWAECGVLHTGKGAWKIPYRVSGAQGGSIASPPDASVRHLLDGTVIDCRYGPRVAL